MKQRIAYGVLTFGGALGLVASFLQMIEKVSLLKHTGEPLKCDLNGVFSCSNVLNAWQSSVFGFPNSLLCMVFFTIFASIGLVGLSGAVLPRNLRLSVQGLSLFVLGFALWFFQQSIFSIGALCILCLFCFTGLLLVNAMWLRINAQDLPISEPARDRLQVWIARGADIFIWIVLALVVAFVMLLKFA